MAEVCIPVAIQVVIDDVGWWSGENGSATGSPFRTGMRRNHVPADYRAIVELGKKLNMRPVASMILCEWDRENILKEVPSATWMGKDWDNSRWKGPWLDEAAEILIKGSQNIELAIHGISHEFWDNGKMSRAEWHHMDGTIRQKSEILAHLDYFFRILRQNKLSTDIETFCPPAFRHRFGLGSSGLPFILKDWGIKYICTMFHYMRRNTKPEDTFFGIDSGIITIERGEDLYSWPQTDLFPKGELPGPICGMHWPNLLHSNPNRNLEVVDRWVEYLSAYGDRFDHMLAPNTAEAFSQLIYNRKVNFAVDRDTITFDFKEFDKVHAYGLLDSFYLKLSGDRKIKTMSHDLHLLSEVQESTSKQRLIKVKRSHRLNQNSSSPDQSYIILE